MELIVTAFATFALLALVAGGLVLLGDALRGGE